MHRTRHRQLYLDTLALQFFIIREISTLEIEADCPVAKSRQNEA